MRKCSMISLFHETFVFTLLVLVSTARCMIPCSVGVASLSSSHPILPRCDPIPYWSASSASSIWECCHAPSPRGPFLCGLGSRMGWNPGRVRGLGCPSTDERLPLLTEPCLCPFVWLSAEPLLVLFGWLSIVLLLMWLASGGGGFSIDPLRSRPPTAS